MSIRRVGMMLFMHSDTGTGDAWAEGQSGRAVGGGFPGRIRPTWDSNG